MSHQTKLSEPRLFVDRHLKDTVKPRKLFSIKELSGNLSLGVNNADISTLECALLTRMYYCEVNGNFVAPPIPDAATIRGRLDNFRSLLLGNLSDTPRLSLRQVVETYRGRRRTIYEGALNRLVNLGLSRKHAASICFVKMELVNPDKAPRCIQPRKPEYNLALGRYIKAVEHPLYKAISQVYGDGPTVMKGFNVTEIGGIVRGKWRSFRRPVAVGLDAVKFDMHVSPQMLDWEHGVYKAIYRNDPMLRKLLRWQMHNKGYGFCADGKLKYSVTGKRFSGDMNTGLGNCLIMCAMVHAYAESRSVHVKLVNNGDDCVVFMEEEDLPKFLDGLDEWFLEMGFRMTAEPPVRELHLVEFCQMHPIEIGSECRMVRNIPVAIRKDTITTHPLHNTVHREKWCTAVGTGGLWLTGGVPVMQDFYQAYQRIGCMRASNMLDDPTFATGMRLMSRGMQSHYSTPTPWARVQVSEAWGISPDEQVALEDYYRQYEFNTGDVHYGLFNSTPILATA